MKKPLLGLLPLLALMVTGCPHNEYVVKLRPHDGKLERELIFHREDGRETNGVPKYQAFPAEELAAITALYPAGGMANKDDTRIAKGLFVGDLPPDVGGAGSYTNIATSVGNAGFYAERFRGNDDLAGRAEKLLRAANQITDLVLGWSKKELGGETNYNALRKFLDTDCRKDLKNAAIYWQQALQSDKSQTNGAIEYGIQFVMYLKERGYFKLSDLPEIYAAIGENGEERLMRFVQRVVARKLGVDDAQPVPAALSFLSDPKAATKSFGEYFFDSEFFRTKISEWEKKAEPGEEKPTMEALIGEQFNNLFEFNIFGDPADHLHVELMLPVAPLHMNGEWNDVNKQVVWNSEIELKTNSLRLPVLCYATWVQPDEDFQTLHFGRVILTDSNLEEYCFWRASLGEKQGREWENLIASLKPGDEKKHKISDFRFSDEPVLSDPKGQDKGPSRQGRSLIEKAFAY